MGAFDKAKSYTHDPAETVALVEGGHWDDDWSIDEIAPIVYDLLHANRADLALPYFERMAEMAEESNNIILRYWTRYGDLPD